jgi:hypothetical protein
MPLITVLPIINLVRLLSSQGRQGCYTIGCPEADPQFPEESRSVKEVLPVFWFSKSFLLSIPRAII